MFIGTVTASGVGRSSIVAPDHFQTPFNVGIVAKVTGTITFSIEYSMGDPMSAGYTAASQTWVAATGFSGISATTGGSLTVPCRAISVNVASGDGSVVVELIQAGPA